MMALFSLMSCNVRSTYSSIAYCVVKKSCQRRNIWLVVLGLMALETVFQSISGRLPEKEKEEK